MTLYPNDKGSVLKPNSWCSDGTMILFRSMTCLHWLEPAIDEHRHLLDLLLTYSSVAT